MLTQGCHKPFVKNTVSVKHYKKGMLVLKTARKWYTSNSWWRLPLSQGCDQEGNTKTSTVLAAFYFLSQMVGIQALMSFSYIVLCLQYFILIYKLKMLLLFVCSFCNQTVYSVILLFVRVFPLDFVGFSR